MMLFRCRDVAENASDYLDEQLSLWMRSRMQFHLLICVNCRRYMHQLRIMLISLANLEPPTVPDPVKVDAIVARLKNQPEVRDGRTDSSSSAP